MALLDRAKPIRTVLRWQLYATIVSALIAAYWRGPHGAYSAMLGGLINIVAGAVFAWLALGSGSTTAGLALYALFRAEAGKVILVIAQLWLVLALYKQIVLGAFFGTFFLTVILSTMALIARDR
ncbi:MAG TPA: ATP synthase subunit I [Burkholderiales bacterium]|nr:ATP synthase subunit I [Burkholderiales bacterium]